jgi:hypothetical protein
MSDQFEYKVFTAKRGMSLDAALDENLRGQNDWFLDHVDVNDDSYNIYMKRKIQNEKI